MANIKSQIKRNRQNDKKRLRNRVFRGEARIAVKNARANIDAGVPESKAALQQAISALDRAAEQGVIHKNNAARRKSRLVKAFAMMEPVQVVAEASIEEPVLDAQPVKKTASRKAKLEEPKVEAATEPKAEPARKKAASTSRKPAAVKKPAASSSKTTPSSKGTSSQKDKKSATRTSSSKGKKSTAKK